VENFETWAQSLLRLASSEGIRKDGEDAGGMDWSPRSSNNSSPSSFTDNVLDSRSTQRGHMTKKSDNGLDLSEDSVCKEIDSLKAFVGNVTQHLMADPRFHEMLRSSETADDETVHLEAANFESLHKHFEPPRVPRSGTKDELQEKRFQEVYKMTELIVFKPLLQVLGLLLMVIMSHRDQGIMIRLATMQSHYNPERAPQELFGISETFRSLSNWKSVVDSLQGIDELTLLPSQRLEQLQVNLYFADSFLCVPIVFTDLWFTRASCILKLNTGMYERNY
jgi:hypothetical protein